MSILHRRFAPVQPAALWPDWTDDDTWEASEADAAWVAENLGYPEGNPPGEPLLPFGEWIRFRASVIRLDRTNAALWLADELDKLADLADLLDAADPATLEALRGDPDATGYTRGWEDGRADMLDSFGRG